MNRKLSTVTLPEYEESQFIKRYFLLVAVGWFITAAREVKILGGIIMIPYFLGIVQYVHVGVLLKNIFSWLHRWIYGESGSQTELKKAVVYPLVLMWIGGMILTALLMFVLPQFKEIFLGMRIELPIMTQFLLGLSDFMVQWWSLVLPLAFGFPLLAAKALSSRSGREVLAPWLLMTPIFGSLYRDLVLAGFYRDWSEYLLKDHEIEESLFRAIPRNFCSSDLQLIEDFIYGHKAILTARTEKDSAKLVQLLKEYEQTVMTNNKLRTKALEVASIIIMGLLIGMVVLAVFMPMGCGCNCAEE